MAGERAHTVTWRQFFGDVDRAVTESEADAEKVTTLGLAYKEANNDYKAGIDVLNALRYEYALAALPVYRHLRIMGYSHTDITK